ncbi:MAG: Fic family protein [Methanomicrobiales archaeon]|nr:Fic family protein [Methanomicrobiales archaeon]
MTFDRTRPYNELPPLPPSVDLESTAILRKCISANRALASLKVAGHLIPNQTILINAIPLQEAKASSEIENIVTTGDALYRADLMPGNPTDPHTKEVLHYRGALYHAFRQLKEGHSITTSLLHSVCNDILQSEVQVRMFGPCTIHNRTTEELVYTAPEGEFVREKLQNIDILYLVDKGLLDLPVLYLSHYIIVHKNDYYRLLRSVTEQGNWEEWILFMLDAIEVTSTLTYYKIQRIWKLLRETTEKCRSELPSTVYSKELIELIFVQPYSKVSSVVDAGLAKRQTAAHYLQELEKIGVLESTKIGRERIYINKALLKILTDGS